jgi:hypothetical protein
LRAQSELETNASELTKRVVKAESSLADAEKSKKELKIAEKTSKYKLLKAKSVKYFEQSLEVVQKYYPENSFNANRLQAKTSYSNQEEN